MSPGKTSETACVEYQLEVDFSAPIEAVWNALLNDVHLWWLPDFHMVGADSRVEFDVSAGGKGLVEYRPDGSFLQWYAVQCYMPAQKKIYLLGHLAPEFGGPSTTSMTLTLEDLEESGCRLLIHDAHFGKVDQRTVDSLSSGWDQLFRDGLKRHVEQGS
ncbi:MAG: SRPBCC domain-containing protein [Planctomycetota bacterium]